MCELKKKYPLLYKRVSGWECLEGWHPLLHGLSAKLEKLIEDGDWDEDFQPYASQVKEKYGTLRFYMSCETDEMSDLIEDAEEKSSKICEICGKPGEIRNKNSWYKTRCDKCLDL